jgi:hypothetical protein
VHRLFLPFLVTTSLLAQVPAPNPDAKLHPYLREQLAKSAPGERLPVYFVIGEKLGYHNFFPRVQQMDKATRRATVLAELQQHMERTQAELIALLEREAAQGRAVIASRNFLGNFVRVLATADAIRGGAALPSVSEVWFDHVPDPAAVEDVLPAPAAGPGNGPLDTKAHLVWAKGITGKGIVWMNSDSGCRVSNTNPTSVHPGLAGKLWINPQEIAGNNLDDDGNGKIDDYHGWNFGANNSSIDDAGGHGTNCAGVFVGTDHLNGDTLGNCPDARIMTGMLGGESSQWDAIQYALLEGADGQTSSHSWKNNFNPPPNYRMHRDVGESTLAAGLIRTNSTSNNGTLCGSTTSTVRRPFNIAAPGCVPAPWLHPDQTLAGRLGGVLGIGAHNVGLTTQPSYTPCGAFAWLLADVQAVLPTYPVANWDSANDNDYPWQGGTRLGLIKPDLTGPTGTRTTSGSSGYTAFSGTSNATPSVSSCLALALSANPSLTPEDMAMAAQTTAIDFLTAGKDNLSGAGRVDAWELTKMARAIHRVNGDVAHTVPVRVTGNLTLALDSIPNRPAGWVIGNGPAKTVIGELTIRVANPALVFTVTTDANGNYSLTFPLDSALVGIKVWSQFVVADADFGGAGGITGSNAIQIQFVN